MQKLLILLIVILFTSCTRKERAITWVVCPCTITEIKATQKQDKSIIYTITVNSIIEDYYLFTFRTTHSYQIGDTIK